MADAVKISVEKLMEKAEEDFEDHFSFRKMHTFPACLGGLHDRYAVPMLVAIGPYHHELERLQQMEKVKRAAASHLSKSWGGSKRLNQVYEDAVLRVAGICRKLYAIDRLPANMAAEDDIHDFAAMMFFDACFLLHYMEVSMSSKQYADALSKLLFSNRGSIDRDIMLLENQLPWLVVQAILDSLPQQQAKDHKDVVGRYIARTGSSFNILEHEKEEPHFEWEESQPQHLLDLLRHYKIGKAAIIPQWPEKVRHISAPSALELAEIGIKLRARTGAFTDMDVRQWGPFCCNLSLAPLSLNDTRACCLVNMAAFEVATGSSYGDHPDRTAVCSYLALFSMFMHREEDVHELRAKRILYANRTDADMLAFFKGVVNHLPDTGFRFANILAMIQDYKKRRWVRTRVHKLMYDHRAVLTAIVKILTVVGTLMGIFQVLRALNKS